MTVGTDLGRKAVLVTGASSGIGRAAALNLDRLGFTVFASVRKERDAEDLRAQASPRLTPVFLDVTEPRTIADAEEKIRRAVGASGLWGLVNNAGISFRAPIELVPLEDLRRLFEVNVFGHLAVTQAFLPLIRQARGRIVMISSITAMIVTSYHGPYSAGKACLNAFSDALRLEMKPFGVRVATLIYGGVRTPIWDKIETETDAVAAKFPAGYARLYAENQRKALAFFVERGRSSLSAEKSIRPIVRALTARRPKGAYFVGTGARLYGTLGRLLSGRLRDWVILRSLGLTKVEAPRGPEA
ncbi:MAG: SDR family NAD(P)-dependent oxidoreductase [Candidatus Aminicenantales bacterium]